MSNTKKETMFKHEGKTVSVIGKSRVKTYKELYNQLSQLQKRFLNKKRKF